MTDMIIEKLKEEVTKNPAANAVLHVFALRKRTAQSVTIARLTQSMKNEGFIYTRGDYESVLKTLADLGVGKLDIDSKGRIRSLRDIKLTLQSIGGAACGAKPNLAGFRQRARYGKLQVPTTTVSKPKVIEVGLDLLINGKLIKIQIPKEFSPEEIAGLISSFQGKQTA